MNTTMEPITAESSNADLIEAVREWDTHHRVHPMMRKLADRLEAAEAAPNSGWLAAHDAEVAAEALERAAEEARRIETGTPWIDSGKETVHCDSVREDPGGWLQARAAATRSSAPTDVEADRG
ncbi:hypothetical protein ACQ3HE_06885 [Plantibacter auratus]|uniref:hypothetical protein n=1 Tax=Plantibacter auratus TaxID=272914 RepID=UPI003D3524A0